MRLKDKIAIVVGAGQSPGEGLRNGRATVLRFAQEGAKVLAIDNNLSSAEETVAMARQAGGECVAFEADVAVEATPSVAAWERYPNVAYKATKAGMIAFTQQVAIQNAEFGVRANVILPGLIDTPMAVDTRARVAQSTVRR
jgi:NAD(P)-dependent dehydrogenase (short-subunit alcohol dehydrogenase family)